MTVLDYGCGYGRSVTELHARGYHDVIGVDPSAALIARAREASPGIQFMVIADPPSLPEQVSRVDLTLVFAVLTCVPSDADQAALMDEVWRVTVPGGLVYVSDLLIEPDAGRYRELAESEYPYGTFRTEAGGLLRHHTADHLRRLVGGVSVQEAAEAVRTMNGGTAHAMQLLARKPV
ncbi:MAG TPA: class I SAM-dependent methyltransferase [Mycobacterium sp.]